MLGSAVSDYIDRIVDGRGPRQRVITQPRPEPDIEPRHRLELSCDPLSFAALALVADLFMLRPMATWLINLSQRLRGTAGCAKPAE